MAGKDNISDLGKDTRFSSTNQPQRNGRKTSTYALIRKLFGTDNSIMMYGNNINEISERLTESNRHRVD